MAIRFVVTMAVWCAAVTAQAQTTRYWGGGTVNKAGGVDALNPANGTWNSTITVWGDAATGTPANYVAWNNGAGDTASFGTRAAAYTLTVPTGGAVTVGGLSTYVFDGSAGVLVVPQSGNPVFTINSGAVLNLAAGTTFTLSPSFSITSSGFTIQGGGTFSVTTYGGSFVSSGILDVQNGVLRLGCGSSQTPFEFATLNLGPSGRFENTRPGDLGANRWRNVTGTGTVQPSTATAYTYPFSLNNPTDLVLNIRILDGTAAGVLTLLEMRNTGKVTLMNTANDYFGNLVRAGTLVPGAAGTVTGFVLVDGTGTSWGTFSPGDASLFTGPVTAVCGGQIDGANVALSQMQLMAGGAVRYNAGSEIPGTGRVLKHAQPGAVIVGGYAFDDAFLQRIDESFDGVIALGADIGSGTTLHFDGAGGNFADTRLGAWGAARTFDGTLVPHGGVYRLGGGNNSLTITSALTGSGALDVRNVGAKGYFGHTSFAGSGTTLTADNTLSGPVTVGNGATLTLQGSNGRVSGATDITVTGGGTLTLGVTGGTNADRIPGVDLTMQNTATFGFTGLRGQTEAGGTLTIDGGYSLVSSAAGTGTDTAVIEFASLNPVNWGIVRFSVGGNSAIRFGTDPAADGALIGPWALVSGNYFAAYQATPTEAVIAAPVTTVASDANWTACDASSRVDLTTAFTASAARTVACIRNRVNAAQTFTWTGLNKVAEGGIIVENDNGTSTTFTGGQWTSGAADHGLYLHSLQIYRTFTFASAIVNDGANAVTLVKGGGGAVTLSSSANTFSGDVVINAGLLTASDANSLGASTGIVLNGKDAILATGNNTDDRVFAQDIQVNADATLRRTADSNSTSGSLTLNGAITLANDCLLTLGSIADRRSLTVNGKISGSGSVRLCKNAYGTATTLTIQGPEGNDYTGDTFIAGPIDLNKPSVAAIPGDVYLGAVDMGNNLRPRPLLRLLQSEQIADTAVVTVGGGSGGLETAVESPVMRLNGNAERVAGLRGLVGNGTVENGHASAATTLTLGGDGDYVFGGLMQNGAAAALALTKTGSGTQALSYANTYSGGTTVSGGTLLARNASGSATGAGSVSVGASGTLGGDGRLAPGTGASIVVAGTLAPGASVGTLTVDLGSTASGVTLNSGAKLACELGAPTAGDKITFLNFGAGDLTLNNNVIDVTDAGGLAEGSYTIMEFYSDGGTTLTDTGKPVSGLVLGTGLGLYSASSIDYAQTGKIILNVARPKGTLITVK